MSTEPDATATNDDAQKKEGAESQVQAQNPIIVLVDNKSSDKPEEESDAPITLSHRQPSYSSLHGVLIPKGGDNIAPMPALNEEENSAHKPAQEPAKPVDENPVIVITKPNEQSEDQAPISLSIRQPSFSNLHGLPIPKGGTNPSDILKLQVPIESVQEEPAQPPQDTNPIVVLTDQQELDDTPIVLNIRQPSFSNLHGTLVPKGNVDTDQKSSFVKDLEKRNAQRWKAMGYEPSMLRRNSTQQALISTPLSLSKPNSTSSQLRQSTQCFYYTKIIEVPTLKEVEEEPSRIQRVSSEGKIKPIPEQSLHLDLVPVKQNQGYDSEQGSSRIPQRLYRLIKHPKESIVFLALCGVSVVGYQDPALNEAAKQLKFYLDQCIERGYVEESQYVQQIIDNLKEERTEVEKILNVETPDGVEESLANAQKAQEKVEAEFRNRKARLEAEKELSLREIDLKHEEELDKIDNEWCSTQKQAAFSKPSPQLIDLKDQAQRLLGSFRFDEAAKMAERIKRKEKEEIQVASERMRAGYDQAIKKAQQKRDMEKQAAIASIESKMISLEKDRQNKMLPLKRRVEALSTKLDEVLTVAKRSREGKEKKKEGKEVKPKVYHTIDVNKSSPLALPPLSKKRRNAGLQRQSTKASSRFSTNVQFDADSSSTLS